MSIENHPLISIAMTVFNAASFLAKTIESLLAQDYENFELIISDNASEDGSSDICQKFAKRDNRIKYYRNAINMGPIRSSQKAGDLCSGEFIMPAADHDVYHPSFISSLLKFLQQDEAVVMAYPRTIIIDEKDHFLELVTDAIDTQGMNACQRFSKIIWEFSWGNMAYGLYRIAAFRDAFLFFPKSIGPDHVVIAKLNLIGSIAQIDEPLFFRRRNRPEEKPQEMVRRQTNWFAKSNYKALVPWTMLAYEQIKVVRDSKLTTNEKDILFADIKNCYTHRFGGSMRNEVSELLKNGKQIIFDSNLSPDAQCDKYLELTQIAEVFRYFYPDISELSNFISLRSRLYQSNQQTTPSVIEPYYKSFTNKNDTFSINAPTPGDDNGDGHPNSQPTDSKVTSLRETLYNDRLMRLIGKGDLKIYAGDIPNLPEYNGWLGFSLTQEDDRHIRHDITQPFPLPDNTVDSFQSEDVFEHIPYDRLVPVVNEIFRALKPGGMFRLSVPDYGCDVLRDRSVKDALGEIAFDPSGGGTKVAPGHVWFPRINTLKSLLEKTDFAMYGTIDYLHYWAMDNTFVTKSIDYSKGYVQRTPDIDLRVQKPYRPMSMVVDLTKINLTDFSANLNTDKNIDDILPAEISRLLRAATAIHVKQQMTGVAATCRQKKVASLDDAAPRCVFLNTYYGAFLNSHYARQPQLHKVGYAEHKQALQETFFGDSKFYSSGMVKAGWRAEDLIINCLPLQRAWARENGYTGTDAEIAIEQIRRLRPDVVYFQDLSVATREFLEVIRPYATLIVGQIASPLPTQTYVKGFDIIISSFPHFVKRFRDMGVTSYYQPLAFDPHVLSNLDTSRRDIGVSFVGGISCVHGEGTKLLEYLASTTPIEFWGYGASSLPPNSPIRARHHGEVWGMEMFHTLARLAITVNRHIDVAENFANNMRLFEATGCGALLITDYKDNLNELFEIGKEVVAYRSPEECATLVNYYLDHPDETQQIAKAGQTRTLREHTYEKRMEHTAELLKRQLRYKGECERLGAPDLQNISTGFAAVQKTQVTDSMLAGWQDKIIPCRQRALVQQQLDELYKGRPQAIYQVLAEILRPYVYSGCPILEIGCASGYYYEILEYMLGKRIAYTGADYSEPLIKMARDYYPNVDFHVADGAHLPFEDKQFDIVISSGVLLHVPNFPEHVTEAVRVSSNLVVAHRTPVCRQKPTQHYRKMAYGVETYEMRFNEDEIISTFKSNGLELIKAYEYEWSPEHDVFDLAYLFKRKRN